jgi:hypothetical protein
MISVVVPTFNRGPKLHDTLLALLQNDMQGVKAEIIVVDDGSRIPAATCVPEAPPGTLRVLRQENAGPARARNTGFRASSGELVLFVDDDILTPPDLVLGHLRAHEERPGSVVFGRCPFPETAAPNPFRRYLDSLGTDPGRGHSGDLMRVPLVASGQISVERAMFDVSSGVYRQDLATPAAEEFELSWRLRERAIPLLLAPRLVAVHDHAIRICSYCLQQYKYGMGCAEAWVKCPEVRALQELKAIIASNSGPDRQDPRRQAIWKTAKGLAAVAPVRQALSRTAAGLERVVPNTDGFLRSAYRAAIGAHFVAGVRDGLRRFSSTAGV